MTFHPGLLKIRNLTLGILAVILCTVVLAQDKITPGSAPDGIRFDGYTQMSGTMYFSMSREDGGQLVGVRWVTVGSSYAGYKIESFDKQNSVLILSKDGKTFAVPLQGESISESPPPFQRGEALAYINSLLATMEENLLKYATYEDLPREISGELTGQQRVGYEHQKSAAEKNGGKLYVVRGENGLPFVIQQQALQFDKLPREAGKMLSESEKRDLNERYQKVSIHTAYVIYLANYYLGNLQPVTGPGQGRGGTLPRGIGPDSRESKD